MTPKYDMMSNHHIRMIAGNESKYLILQYNRFVLLAAAGCNHSKHSTWYNKYSQKYFFKYFWVCRSFIEQCTQNITWSAQLVWGLLAPGPPTVD
jgi:hypothetical protein